MWISNWTVELPAMKANIKGTTRMIKAYVVYHIYILKYLAKSLSILNSELVVWNSELVVFHPRIFPYVWTSQGFSKVKIICLLKSAKTKKLVLASGSQTWPANKKTHLFGKLSNFHLDYIYIYTVYAYIYIYPFISLVFPLTKHRLDLNWVRGFLSLPGVSRHMAAWMSTLPRFVSWHLTRCAGSAWQTI